MRVLDPDWVATRHPSYVPAIEAVRALGDHVVTWSPAAPSAAHGAPSGSPDVRTLPDSDDWDLRVSTLRSPRGDLTSVHKVSRRGMPGMTTRFYVQELEQLEWVQEIPARAGCAGQRRGSSGCVTQWENGA